MTRNASTAEGWDEEYRGGRWAFLHDLPESGRYGVIAMWLKLTSTLEHVLDVGCGEGLLYKRLKDIGLGHYVGVDLSPAALALANVDPDRATLRTADFNTFAPAVGEHFSAIVFNEVLHFADDIAGVMERYRAFLAPGGVIAISMYAPKRADSGANRLIARLWKATDADSWRVLDDIQLVSNKKSVTWRLRLVQPFDGAASVRKDRTVSRK